MAYCSVINCKNRSRTTNKQNDGITYHRYPTEPICKEYWIEATGRRDWFPTKLSTICSKHFAEEHIVIKKSGNRYLQPDAVPTKDIWRREEDHLSQSSSQTKRESQVDVDDGVKKSTGDIPCKQVPLKRTVNKCNECNRYILRCRYVCVQCVDHEVCEKCEARGAHLLHYVLRVPADKPHDEAKAILEKIREIINRESENKEDQEVPIDESDCVNSEVGNARDPLEGEDSIVKIEPGIVKIEPQDFNELEPATQTDDAATIKREEPAEPQQRQQSRKRKASSEPHTGATPVTLPDTQIRICLDRVTEAISKRSNTQTSTSSSQNTVSSWSQIIKEHMYSFPNYAVTNVGTTATLDQPVGSVVPVVTSSSRQREGGGAPRPQREHAAVQVVSLDPAPAQQLVIKVESPD